MRPLIKQMLTDFRENFKDYEVALPSDLPDNAAQEVHFGDQLQKSDAKPVTQQVAITGPAIPPDKEGK